MVGLCVGNLKVEVGGEVGEDMGAGVGSGVIGIKSIAVKEGLLLRSQNPSYMLLSTTRYMPCDLSIVGPLTGSVYATPYESSGFVTG